MAVPFSRDHTISRWLAALSTTISTMSQTTTLALPLCPLVDFRIPNIYEKDIDLGQTSE
jgi:hypothetical protein